MRRRLAAAAAIALAIFAAAAAWQFHNAPSAPYAGLQSREIRTLSEKDVADLREGRGMGYALAAELNGYPGPRHVLDMAGKLGLTPGQRQRTQQLFDLMKNETAALGGRFIEAERSLDALFASRRASPGDISLLAGRAASIEGELRAAHLKYHVAMLEVMSPEQVEAYNSLRGYGEGHQMKH